MEGAQRTPVSLLLDMCNQNDWEKPEYELIEVKGASHDPTFTYKVNVQGAEAVASGQSKRKAKHFAAKSVLEQLLSRSGNSFEFEGEEITSKNLNNIIVEPSSEPVPKGNDARNAIGELQEYCMKTKKGSPYYETVEESGPPHDKIFSLQCMVSYLVEGETSDREFTTYGKGKTKRIAKREAAELMHKELLEFDAELQSKKEPTKCEHIEVKLGNESTETSDLQSKSLNNEANSDISINQQKFEHIVKLEDNALIEPTDLQSKLPNNEADSNGAKNQQKPEHIEVKLEGNALTESSDLQSNPLNNEANSDIAKNQQVDITTSLS